METALLSAIPLLCRLAAFAYAARAGLKAYKSTGHASILGIATTLLGLAVGRLVDRFVPLFRAIGNPFGYQGMKVEVALLALFAAATTVLAVTLAEGDAVAQPGSRPGLRRCALLAAIFLSSAGITARGKLAAFLAFLLSKAAFSDARAGAVTGSAAPTPGGPCGPGVAPARLADRPIQRLGRAIPALARAMPA
jgi:hypothetical protein